MSPIVLAIICALMLTGGQVCWKLGLKQVGGFLVDGHGVGANLVAIATSPLILWGCVAYALATLVWFNVLSRLPLSVAYPLMSLGYVVGVLVSVLIFREAVSPMRWIGAAVIVLGVALIARS
jgi:drug/metabolite transporter (DMT)-like permease